MTPENPLNNAFLPTGAPSILVVDDQPQHLNALTEILEKGGYQVQRAQDGARALAVVQTQPPALVLVDVLLPDMDGYTLCQQLKAQPQTQQTPIIFLSSPEPVADVARGLAVGGVDYLTKPWQADEVLTRVRIHLGAATAGSLPHTAFPTGRPERLRVFVVEPHALLRRGLSILLTHERTHLTVVGTASNCASTLPLVKTQSPDLLVVAWPLPTPEGVTEVMALNALGRPLLMLAANVADEGLLRLVQLGVAGCLPNNTEVDEIVETLHSLHQGASVLPPQLTQRFLAETGPRAAAPPLTKRERDIVQAVAQGLSNNRIAERLGLSPATIRTHVSRLLQKLGLTNRTQLALYARDQGFMV